MLASGQVTDIVTCLILLDGLCKTGHIEEALKLFQAMQNSGLELEIVPYTILIDGFVKLGISKLPRNYFINSQTMMKHTGCLGAWEIMTVCLIAAIIM
ncbi:hypothetical protein Gotur_029204 [Gossypium turneri]